ncbi:MAG: aminoacetone oxidase family FAD-binding enzyme [Oscillospiraceae bacterium]|nr:aminoacetone oxidase family FAD-binding enzyme [Oscillospiraceae bacterium]
MKRVIIIGGGASGMAAALRAAERGAEVTLLERQARLGRKLLATGNGRCNLTNTQARAPGHYHGEAPGFAVPALDTWPPEAVLDYFAALGLKTVTEYGGRIYPMSDHAGSVLDVLRLALENAGVRIITGAAVEGLSREKGGFLAHWDGGEVRGNVAIVACGGCAGSRLGGVMDGYRLLQSLGHSRTPLYPALAPLRTASEYPRALKGIRVDASVRLRCGGKTLAEARGDVLFTETGLSGTAIFDIARAAALGGAGLRASLDFFPGENAKALRRDLDARRARWPELEANRVLTGTVHNRLGLMLCKAAGLSGGAALGAVPDAALDRLSALMKDFSLEVTGVGGFDAAQVTAGGVRCSEFVPETLQSRLVPGLYACGEVLDIDGDCGGFNLQWAWASGLLAGETR